MWMELETDQSLNRRFIQQGTGTDMEDSAPVLLHRVQYLRGPEQ